MPGTLGVQQPDALQTGVITTAGGPTDPSSYVSISCGDGYSTWSADLRGTFSAGTTIVFEVCLDGINWVPAAGAPVGSTSPALVQSITGAGPKDYTGTSAAMQQFRVRATAIQGGDAVKVVLRLSIATASSLSTGGGGSTVNQGSPNTLANAWPVELTDGTNVLGTSANPVRVDPTGTTPQPVTVASLPLPASAATAANQATEIANLQALNSLVPSVYDYISLSYTGTNLTTVVYMVGGSGGTVVSTLTLAYTGSNLTSVTKS